MHLIGRHILVCQVVCLYASERLLERPLLRPWELNVRHCLISLDVEATAALDNSDGKSGVMHGPFAFTWPG
jgi:hypothetical protein